MRRTLPLLLALLLGGATFPDSTRGDLATWTDSSGDNINFNTPGSPESIVWAIVVGGEIVGTGSATPFASETPFGATESISPVQWPTGVTLPTFPGATISGAIKQNVPWDPSVKSVSASLTLDGIFNLTGPGSISATLTGDLGGQLLTVNSPVYTWAGHVQGFNFKQTVYATNWAPLPTMVETLTVEIMGPEQYVAASSPTFDVLAPEPNTLTLVAGGAVGALGFAWRRRKQTA